MPTFVNHTSNRHKTNRVLLIYTGGTIGMGKTRQPECWSLWT